MVVDASMVVAWFVVAQTTSRSRQVLSRVENEALYAPPLLQVELASALVKLAHRGKITPGAINGILTEFEALETVIDKVPPTARTIASVCRRYAVSAYDAAYLELAIRLDVPLATGDGPLLDAARAAGVAFA